MRHKQTLPSIKSKKKGNRDNDEAVRLNPDEPDSDNNLEDEYLRFIGYCYTTTGGNDKSKV